MIGKTISHYKILERLGGGGMGVVYKAEDTKLKRTVALKFLPPAFSLDEESKKRFIHEAQAASSLQHSNICTIHDIDETKPAPGETGDGQLFICMDYYEGDTLKQKIERGPIEIDEAIDITIQIAEGLLKAHEKEIIHRDIKSANIFITNDGVVKILDFGLAKISGRTKLTQPGTTFGTISYMAPEQARGEKVDQRTDIWALGVVLYEMITGMQPFKGEYDQAVIYSIMNESPDLITGLRTGVPMELERIVNKLMAKNPTDRYQHIDELPVDLKSIDLTITGTSKNSTAKSIIKTKRKPPSWVKRIPWSIAVLMTLVAIIAIWFLQRTSSSPVKRWNIKLPDSAPIAPIGSAPLGIGRPALTISSDGTNLVYVADIGDKTQLYLRQMDQFDAVPIAGTEGAYHPFFSPDGHWVGFFVGNELKKVSILGGEPVSLCEAVNTYGVSWKSKDKIIFSPSEGNALSSVSSAGGIPQVITKKSSNYSWPEILPGGKAVLVSGIKVVFLDTGEEKALSVIGYNPRYLSTGHLVYTQNGRLQAVPFDLDIFEVTGHPIPILDNVRNEASRDAIQYTISGDGILVYIPGTSEAKSTLVWQDRKGKVEQLQFPIETYGTFQIYSDGRRLAIQVYSTNWNVWIYDLIRGSRFKLTLESDNRLPIWTPDGKWVTFSSDRTGPFNLFMKSVDGSGQIKQLKKSKNNQYPYSWTPDGKLLAFTERTPSDDIMLFSMNDETKPQSIANTRFNEWGSDFSPDGRLIAYTSDEQGQYDVYVQPFPQTGERWRVSTEGGEEPVWSPNANELFYRNGRKWMVVAYATTPKFNPEVPQVLFEGDYVNVRGRSYDVSPDGKRFLLVRGSEKLSTHTQLNVVLNWFEELK